MKPKLSSPFPNLPYLIDNDRTICETDAILFYIASKKGRGDLFGIDFEERLLLIQVRGVIKDLQNKLSDLVYNANYNEVLKETYLKEDGFIQKKLSFLHKFIEGKKFLLGNNVKFVDFFLYETVQMLKKLAPKVLEKYERFDAHGENVRKLNGIAAYLKSERFDAKKTFTNPLHSISNI